jgi:hypothetical protein
MSTDLLLFANESNDSQRERTGPPMLARLLGDIESFVEGRPVHDAAAPA